MINMVKMHLKKEWVEEEVVDTIPSTSLSRSSAVAAARLEVRNVLASELQVVVFCEFSSKSGTKVIRGKAFSIFSFRFLQAAVAGAADVRREEKMSCIP